MTIKDYVLLHTTGNVYWKNKHGMYLGCNLEFAQAAGAGSPAQVVGKSDRELLSQFLGEEALKNIIAVDQAVIKNDKAVTVEEVGMDGRGKKACYLTKKMPLKDKRGKIIGLMGVSINITAKKRAEAREKAAALKAAAALARAEAETEMRQAITILAGSIAHDLRTPLSLIRTIGEVIEDNLSNLIEGYRLAVEAGLPVPARLSPAYIKKLANIGADFTETVQEMNAFIDTTLKTIRRAITGELKKEDLATCDLDWCVQNTLQRYPFTREQRDLVNWDRSCNFKFLGNSVLFFRVLSNLVKNALYQIDKNKKGEIFLSASKTEDANILHFKDTAGGASPAVVKRVFEGYRTTKEEGTGIGLSFCKFTLQSFGGDITCHSVEGDYMEFLLSFPVNNSIK